MFFNDISEVANFASKTHCVILVAPLDLELPLKNALEFSPKLESVREINVNMKQFSDQYIIISPADELGDVAANTLLKTLEEPAENYHFILRTENPSAILPTIRSRAEMFILKQKYDFEVPIDAPKTLYNDAKKLLSLKPAELPKFAETIAKKDGAREDVLEIIAIAIEILYKSYFKTNNLKFADLLPKYIKLYDNISKNGHIKTHLVADLL